MLIVVDNHHQLVQDLMMQYLMKNIEFQPEHDMVYDKLGHNLYL